MTQIDHTLQRKVHWERVKVGRGQKLADNKTRHTKLAGWRRHSASDIVWMNYICIDDTDDRTHNCIHFNDQCKQTIQLLSDRLLIFFNSFKFPAFSNKFNSVSFEPRALRTCMGCNFCFGVKWNDGGWKRQHKLKVARRNTIKMSHHFYFIVCNNQHYTWNEMKNRIRRTSIIYIKKTIKNNYNHVFVLLHYNFFISCNILYCH